MGSRYVGIMVVHLKSSIALLAIACSYPLQSSPTRKKIGCYWETMMSRKAFEVFDGERMAKEAFIHGL